MNDDDLADRGTRLLAAGVDGLLVGGAGLASATALTTLAVASGHAELPAAPVYAAFLVGGGAATALQWWLIARDGQSVGKRWLDVRIVLLDGRTPGFFQGVVVRGWLPWFLGRFCGVFTLLDLFAIVGEERRTLHDRMAGTKVVRASVAVRPSGPHDDVPDDEAP